MPTDATAYNYKDTVVVEDALVSQQKYAYDAISGKKVSGKWTFVFWDKEDFQITEDTVITGAWVFTPDEPPVTPTETGDSNIVLWMALLLISGSLFAATSAFGRRKKSD